MIYRAVFMAFLAYLSEFQKSIPYPEPCAHRQSSQIEPLYDDVLTESAIIYLGSPCAESIYLFHGKQAYLPVPFARVSIALYAPVRDEGYRRHFSLLCALFFTYAYSNYLARAAHMPILLSVTSGGVLPPQNPKIPSISCINP